MFDEKRFFSVSFNFKVYNFCQEIKKERVFNI